MLWPLKRGAFGVKTPQRKGTLVGLALFQINIPRMRLLLERFHCSQMRALWWGNRCPLRLMHRGYTSAAPHVPVVLRHVSQLPGNSQSEEDPLV